jgi:predicted metal-dependent phosphoesterase TrpH
MVKGFKLDLHVHTWFSKDGIYPPRLVLKTALKKGLDAIAITDHNSIRGLGEAKSNANDIIVIPGIEVDTNEGHVIGLGIDRLIKPWLSAAETIELIRGEGGITVIPHPFDYLRHGVGSRVKTLKADAIEIMNSRSNTPFSNSFARRTAHKMESPITAGSDAHLAEDVGNAYMIIEEEGKPSLDSILSLLISKKHRRWRTLGRLTSLRSRVRKIALETAKRASVSQEY